jgi:hypothetical protein
MASHRDSPVVQKILLSEPPRTPVVSTSPVRAALSSSRFVKERVAQFNILSPQSEANATNTTNTAAPTSAIKKRGSPTTASPAHPAKRRRVVSTNSPFVATPHEIAQVLELAASIDAPESVAALPVFALPISTSTSDQAAAQIDSTFATKECAVATEQVCTNTPSPPRMLATNLRTLLQRAAGQYRRRVLAWPKRQHYHARTRR